MINLSDELKSGHGEMNALSLLERRLEKTNVEGKIRAIKGAYNQLVVSNTGKKAEGELRNYFNRKINSNPELAARVVNYVVEKLEFYGLNSYVRILKEQHKDLLDKYR